MQILGNKDFCTFLGARLTGLQGLSGNAVKCRRTILDLMCVLTIGNPDIRLEFVQGLKKQAASPPDLPAIRRESVQG